MPQSILASRVDIDHLNRWFEHANPTGILEWCLHYLPKGLVQASSFEMEDLLITDIVYRHFERSLPVLFVDTLHHFPETMELVAKATALYGLDIHVSTPLNARTREEFTAQFGENLWEKDILAFHNRTKLEPLTRGLGDLEAIAWITSSRREQRDGASDLPIFEWDTNGRLKINPLANWTRTETWAYVFEHDLIYNPLHDQGYSRIGNALSPLPVGV